MKLFNRRARLIDKNYLLSYDVYNKHHSLIKPVCCGSFQCTSNGPEDQVAPLSTMTDYVTKQVLDSLDTETIGRDNGLYPEHLTPESFTVVFVNITRVF